MQSRRGFFAALLGFVAGAFALPKWMRAESHHRSTLIVGMSDPGEPRFWRHRTFSVIKVQQYTDEDGRVWTYPVNTSDEEFHFLRGLVKAGESHGKFIELVD